MVRNETECVICHAPLIYHDDQRMMSCRICGRMFMSNAECVNGHYVCDGCHSSEAVESVEEFCLASRSKDPIGILTCLMSRPEVHMHGPEHHILVGSALLTAYYNARGDIDLPSALKEMRNRGSQVPGGICGLWGCCGAAVSCGTAYSIITRSSPLSGRIWGLCNLMTSKCLEAVSAYGGPRCCKRDGMTALIAATRFIGEHDGVAMDLPDDIVCGFSERNLQCLGAGCPYHRNRWDRRAIRDPCSRDRQ